MSTPAKHTPGPWFYDDSMAYRIAINSERASVAVIPYLDREGKANARLISAAPDLLAALKDVADGFIGTEYEDVFDDARAAIAKAEGRS